ncbi:MAG: hypothetical protein M0R51_13195 [Clostridia bacterium]|nr:hypothetical protein [Clostridia bacterium]
MLNELDSYSWDNNDTESKYSIEPHGEEGQYALYYGRDCQHHGARLCNLYDFDMNKDKVIRDICDALNEYKSTK